jgi:hypothetical protein
MTVRRFHGAAYARAEVTIARRARASGSDPYAGPYRLTVTPIARASGHAPCCQPSQVVTGSSEPARAPSKSGRPGGMWTPREREGPDPDVDPGRRLGEPARAGVTHTPARTRWP